MSAAARPRANTVAGMRTPLLFALAAGTLLAAPALAQTATGSKPGAPTASTTNAAGSAGTGSADRRQDGDRGEGAPAGRLDGRRARPHPALCNAERLGQPAEPETATASTAASARRPSRPTASATLNAGTATVHVWPRAALGRRAEALRLRLGASNAGRHTRGASSVHVPRAPAALTFAARSSRVSYEGAAVFTGNATSAGAGGVAVVLSASPSPSPARSSRLRPSARAATAPTRSRFHRCCCAKFRVLARAAPPVTSAPLTVRTKVRVAIKVTRVSGRRVRFSGDIVPSVSGGRVSLQRRSGGRFVTVRRASVRHPSPVARPIASRPGHVARPPSTGCAWRPYGPPPGARGTSGQRRVAGRR